MARSKASESYRLSRVEKLIETKTEEIRSALSRLGRKMKDGDDSELLHWVIPQALACSQRPLRYHPLYGVSGANIPAEAGPLVKDWATFIQCLGIKSIISLMHDRDLGYYAKLDLGAPTLVEFYKLQGFEVAHLPWEDPLHKRTPKQEVRQRLLLIRRKALDAYNRLTKPVLIQCSAGIDRTAPVAAYIFANRISCTY